MNSKIFYGIIIISFILLFVLSVLFIVYYNTIKLCFSIGSLPRIIYPLRNEGYDKINFKENYTNIPRVIYLTYKDKNKKILECVENWKKIFAAFYRKITLVRAGMHGEYDSPKEYASCKG